MSTPLEGLVEGWTEQIVETLTSDDVAVNLQDLTVTLLLYDNRNRAVTLQASQYGIKDAATGKVYFNPGANDLQAVLSPYSVRWKVVDGSNKVAFFPDGMADPGKWVVRKP